MVYASTSSTHLGYGPHALTRLLQDRESTYLKTLEYTEIKKVLEGLITFVAINPQNIVF